MTEQGHDIEDYKLPSLDTQEERRNFPGYDKNQYYSLADMQEDYRYEQAGTTDTDSETDGSKNYEGYAKIYRKKGKKHGHGGKQLGFKVGLAKDTKNG